MRFIVSAVQERQPCMLVAPSAPGAARCQPDPAWVSSHPATPDAGSQCLPACRACAVRVGKQSVVPLTFPHSPETEYITFCSHSGYQRYYAAGWTRRTTRRRRGSEQRLCWSLRRRAQVWPGRRRRHWGMPPGALALAWARASQRPCMRCASQMGHHRACHPPSSAVW